MAQLLGDNMLPDTVVSRRRQFRERVRSLRDPVRDFRDSYIPGPDIIGTAENKLTDLRERVVTRDTAVNRIKQRRSDNSDSSSDSSSGGSSSSESSSMQEMT